MSYEDTLLAVDAGLREQGIPYEHMLLDSWWCARDGPNVSSTNLRQSPLPPPKKNTFPNRSWE